MTRWRRAFRFRLRRSDIDREVDDELDYHIERTIARLVEEGMTRAEATKEAAARFGDRERHGGRARRIARRRFRRRRGLEWIEALGHDVRVAVRSLRRRPAFACSTILVLGLGIAAATTVFSFARAVLLRPLPYPESDALVRIEETVTPDAPGPLATHNLTLPDIERIRERSTRLSAIGAFVAGRLPYADDRGARRLPSAMVDGHLFGVLGAAPVIGRTFTEDDLVEGGEPVAIIAHDAWIDRFGGDSEVLGRTLDLNFVPYRIVGVMPAGFDFPEGARVWRPLRRSTFTRRFHVVNAVGRLAPGSTVAAAEEEVSTLVRAWVEPEPELHGDATGARVRGWHDQLVADVRPAMLVLGGAVAVLMILVCVNVAGLLTSRALEREREVALRRSLGASPGRLARTVLCESLLLAGVGGLLGSLLSRVTLGSVVALSPADLPARDLVTADARVAVFTAAVALLIGLASGLIPALHSGRVSAPSALKSGGTGAVGGGGSGVRGGALIAVEVGMATLLVVGGSLLLHSFVRMLRVDTGLGRLDVLSASISLPPEYEEGESTFEFFARLRREAGAIPGVTDAAVSLFGPLDGALPIGGIAPPGVEPGPEDTEDPVRVLSVSPGYFRLVGIPVVAGRTLRESDDHGAPRVAVASRMVARRFFGDRDPVGLTLRIGGAVEEVNGAGTRDAGETVTIVGLVEDVRQEGALREPPPLLYLPFEQYIGWAGGNLLLGSAGDASTLVSPLRDVIRRLDPRIPLDYIETIAQRLSGSVAQPRFFTVLVVCFALLASLVAVAGLYGVLAYDVRRRFTELGIRAVLGARPRDNVALLLGRGAFYVGLGIAAGLVAAMPLTRGLESLMYGIEPGDPFTVAAAALLMFAVGIGAALVPARRATRADPAATIRAE